MLTFHTVSAHRSLCGAAGFPNGVLEWESNLCLSHTCREAGADETHTAFPKCRCCSCYVLQRQILHMEAEQIFCSTLHSVVLMAVHACPGGHTSERCAEHLNANGQT